MNIIKKFNLFAAIYSILLFWAILANADVLGIMISVSAAELSEAKAENGFVSNIIFPIPGVADNVPDYEFDPNTLEYDITIPDTATTGGLKIAISEKYENEELYCSVCYNGKMASDAKLKMQLISSSSSAIGQLSLFKATSCPVGQSTLVSVMVGTKNEKDEYDKVDTYNYHVTRSLGLSKFTLGNNLTLIPAFDRKKSPYVDSYTTIYTGDEIALTLGAVTAGVNIVKGNGEEEDSIKLDKYRDENTKIAIIPITLTYGDGSNQIEKKYTLYVSPENYTPQISSGSDQKVVKKNAKDPLKIEATAGEGGVLSYQWYDVTKRVTLIEGATSKEYQPPTIYAGTYKYRCIVTNTIGNLQFTDSKDYTYEVEKDTLTAPEVVKQPAIVDDGSKVFFENAAPEIEIGLLLNADNSLIEGVPYTVAVYRSTTPSKDDAVKIEGTETKIERFNRYGTFDGKPTGMWIITLPSQEVTGTYYYFVQVTVSEEGKTDSKISDPLALTFKGVTDIVQKLEGMGSEEKPFLLYTADDLLYVKRLVEGTENGTAFSFSGNTLAFAADIVLPVDWEPIGNLKPGTNNEATGANLQPFSGIIDGKGHTLTVARGGKSLINYARKATVKNLILYGEQIDGYGLVESYTVDYGETGQYVDDPVKLRTINIENVTIKEGTRIKKSGFIGGYASGANAVHIKNCVAKPGVVIGYDKKESHIGSFAGEFNGTMQNCVSYATVYGVDTVGGLIGNKGQSMGSCDLVNCSFQGKVAASGERAGGLMGAGYISPSAPGTPVVQIHNCFVAADISGKSKVGGIIGSEEGKIVYNEKGDQYGVKGAVAITDNFFYGKLEGSNTGGIIGYLHDFEKNTGEASNFFLEGCGASKGIGGVADGEAIGLEKHSMAMNAQAFAQGVVLNKLNSSNTSYKNWDQGKKYPILSNKPVIIGLNIDGDFKSTYYIGEELDLTGMEITAIWSDGKTTNVDLKDSGLRISGYDKSARGTQEITIKLGAVAATFKVTVLKGGTGEITVYFTLYGDKIHDSDAEGAEVHTLSDGNLEQWIARTEYKIDQNATVKDLLDVVLKEKGWTCQNQTGNYVESITRDKVTIGEFTNGKLSGWMYTLNEKHPLLGVSEQYLEDKDEIVFHYTDNYEKENAFPGGDTSDDPVSSDITATVKGNVAVVIVSQGYLDSLAGQAVEAQIPEAVLNIVGAGQAERIIVEVSRTSLAELAEKKNLSLWVRTPVGQALLDAAAIKFAAASATSDTMQIVCEKQEISAEQKNHLDDAAAAMNVQILSGDQQITSLGSGRLTVFLPVSESYNGKSLAAAVLGQDGKLVKVSGETATVEGKLYFRLQSAAPGIFVLAETAAMDAAIKAQDETGTGDDNNNAAQPAAGTSLTDSKTGQVYTVNKGGSTVSYKKPKSKTVTTATVPATVTLEGKSYQVTAIAASAFSGCTKLKTVSIGKNVTSIGKKAFYGCKKLTKIVIPGKVKTVGSEAFSGCTGLKTATIGKNVTSIGSQAFYGCKALTKITIPGKVKTVGSQTFSGCTSLKTAAIGSGVTSIGKKAFYGCKKLTKITVPGKVKTIGSEAFSGCTGLTTATIGKTVSSIGKKAFHGCKKLKSITIKTTKLTSKKVGANAFKGIYAKASIKVPKSKKNAYTKILKAKGIGKNVKIK